MEKVLDFNELFFGDINEYKKLIISLLESLKDVTSASYWIMDTECQKGLSTVVAMEVINLILDSLDKVSDNLYANDIITQEFPFFVEIKEMIECLLLDPIYESEKYLNLAITLFSDFFTLLEVKLLLFDGCSIELEAPNHVLEEYDKELENYMERLDKYRDEFIAIHN
ncbi:MAG: hypothetical protein BZ135_04230 [Methanosphaera sp. rholeuAM6]|nr:MAG: hypothetical protein BZ135_04230 [Methanosphaera sp. rholeuAM6]